VTWKKLRPYDEPPKPRRRRIPDTADSAATAFWIAALCWLVASTGLGALAFVQLIVPDIVSAYGPLSYGRLFPLFVNALVYGWLSNAAIGAIFFITPRVTGERLHSERLGNVTMTLWNLVAVALGVASVALGFTEGRPLAEFTKPFDVALLGVLVLVNVNFWATVVKATGRGLYISLYYFGAALVAFPIVYVVGNTIGLGGTTDALLNAFYVRGVEGYWLLATAVGALYYVVPRLAGSRLYSGPLALLGFWSFVALWGLSGAQALTWYPIPPWLQALSTAASVLLVAPAFLVVTNLLLTLRGAYRLVITSSTVGYALVALAFLLVVSLLQAILPLRSVAALVGLTEWVLGVSLMAMLGAYSFAFYAVADHALPRLTLRPWASDALKSIQFIASFAGVLMAGFALLIAGLLKGSMLVEDIAPSEIGRAMTGFYAIAVAGLGLVALGAASLLGNLFLTYTSRPPVRYRAPAAEGTDLRPTTSAASGD
jgi:cytochrome c oxidase cbb3-type subunit 1